MLDPVRYAKVGPAPPAAAAAVAWCAQAGREGGGVEGREGRSLVMHAEGLVSTHVLVLCSGTLPPPAHCIDGRVLTSAFPFHRQSAAVGALAAPHVVPHRGDGRAADAAGGGAAAAPLPAGTGTQGQHGPRGPPLHRAPSCPGLVALQPSLSQPGARCAAPALSSVPMPLRPFRSCDFPLQHMNEKHCPAPPAGVPSHHAVQEPRRGAAAGGPGKHSRMHGSCARQARAHGQRAGGGGRPHRLAPAPGPLPRRQRGAAAGREPGRAAQGMRAAGCHEGNVFVQWRSKTSPCNGIPLGRLTGR